MTLDGKIATRGGKSKWITGEKARRHGRRIRARVDAMMVGIGTVLADDPRLTARAGRGRDPVRIIIDSRARTPLGAKVLPANADSSARCIVVTTSGAPKKRTAALERAGADVWTVGRGKVVHLPTLARRLAAEGIGQVLCEGGGTVHASLVTDDLADDLLLYVAPIAFGGADAPSWLGGRGVLSIEDAATFELVGEPERLGSDIVLRARKKLRKP
jgi:diaminohydroxyphosphoribosylaminopyrimidine deaminase/5-amino-6-(5-phosphoribosylamino)uracil reductase